MSKTFLKSGNQIRVRDKDSVKATDVLPVGTYTVKFDERATEFFLEVIEDFVLPDKIYGKNTDYSKRILRTFADRPGSTGVLLSGIKGAGKTLLAKQASVSAFKKGIPTIVINRDWHGDEFNSFIQSISTPSIILFDEFEKIYDWSSQRKVLTLFDGVFNSRKLFLITTNNDRDISEFLQNRPGRMFYNFKFDTLDQEFIAEYLDDRLDDKSQIEGVLKYTNVFSFFNFDMLAAAVEEMNRYNESLAEVLEVLNITPENRKTDTFRLELVLGEQQFILERDYKGFQPNTFEYIIWTDEDMPDAITKDSKAKAAILRMVGKRSSSSGGGSGNPKPILASDDEDDIIKFNPATINRFDQEDSRFVYAIERNGIQLELHVTRNKTNDVWKYHPDAL